MKKTQLSNPELNRSHVRQLVWVNQLKNNNNNIENNIPLLFKKKISKNLVMKPLTYIRSDTGKTRHFTPAAQEWYNSIYAYNKNYVKSLSIADKNLMNLLKSFFNSQKKQKLLNKKSKSILPKFRRLSGKRVFIGKGELKHTSNKVMITFYVYNTENMFLTHKLMQFNLGLLLIENKIKLKKTVTKDSEGNIKITYNRLFSLKEYINLRKHYEWYLSNRIKSINKQTSKVIALNKIYKSLRSLVWEKLLTNEQIYLIFNSKIKNFYVNNLIKFQQYIIWAEERYKNNLSLYFKLLSFNKLKFDSTFNLKLIDLVQQIYNKKVQFNIVNLKKMHLNSDIYTQAVSLKLKNRDNKLYRVLKASLRKIKLPVIRKIDEKQKKPNRDEFFVNRIRNNTVSTMFSLINKKTKNINDRLQNLLLKFYPSVYNNKINVIKRSSNIKRTVSLENFVLRSLKHLKLRGIRVEAKGRLTRRFTASRSVFKMRLKGGLKNVDSSFRGLSTIMLRGIVKSNLQYSIINSKNRNGAYGVKGWVSSK
jgi:hypothetical protein